MINRSGHDISFWNYGVNHRVNCFNKEKYQKVIYENKNKWDEEKENNNYNGGGIYVGIDESKKWVSDKKG